MAKTLFITGTGTDVGKTFVTGLILKKLREGGLRPAYYKAAMSGNDRGTDGRLIPGDAVSVKAAAGLEQPLEEMCPYVYENAVSPHLASRLEGDPVELDRVLEGFRRVCARYEYVAVEGSGGILCPIRMDGERKLWLPEIVRACGLDCLLVADAGLGTINSVGLTAYYLRREGIPLKGIIMNHFRPGDPLHEDNRAVCEQLTGAEVVACVRDGDRELDISLERLRALFEEGGRER